MNSANTTSVCTCGSYNAPLCERQHARTGKRFCNGTMKSTGRDMTGVYRSYAAAAGAAKPGQRVLSCRPGFANGAPRQFCLVDA